MEGDQLGYEPRGEVLYEILPLRFIVVVTVMLSWLRRRSNIQSLCMLASLVPSLSVGTPHSEDKPVACLWRKGNRDLFCHSTSRRRSWSTYLSWAL